MVICLEQKNNINTLQKPKTICCRCGISNGGPKRWKFRFRYSYSANVCSACVSELGSAALTKDWFERNAIFSEKGFLIGFKKGQESAITPAQPPTEASE